MCLPQGSLPSNMTSNPHVSRYFDASQPAAQPAPTAAPAPAAPPSPATAPQTDNTSLLASPRKDNTAANLGRSTLLGD